jgi:NDP-sugar pyrophosphorylase family protein
MKKYELTDESLEHDGHTLYRIKALRSFSNVKKGDLGGYVEKERNLSHYEDSWVYDDAHVFGSANIYDNAWISDDAKVYGNAHVFGNASVHSNAKVCGNARVYGNARIHGKSEISGNCILKFNDFTHLKIITLNRGIWIDTITTDNKKYIISNTLEQLYIGDVE